MKTYAEIISLAYSKNIRITPNRGIADATEGLSLAHEALRALYLFIGSLAPAVIGVREAVAYDVTSGGWPRPASSNIIYWRETATGTEVELVPLRNRVRQTVNPTVYSWGNVYFAAGNAADLTVDQELVLFYSPSPAVPGSVEDELDSRWLEQFDDLLALELAVRMNLKMGMEDIAPIKAERDGHARLLLTYLRTAELGMSAEFDADRQFTDTALQTASQVLAGGAQLS